MIWFGRSNHLLLLEWNWWTELCTASVQYSSDMWILMFVSASQEIFTGNTMISWGSLNMAVSRLAPTTYSLETMLTEESTALRQYASCLHTKSSIPWTFFFLGATMNAPLLTESTGSTMSASGDTVSDCGRYSPTASTASLLLHSSMIRYSACTVGSLLSSEAWTRSRTWGGLLMSRQADYSVISCGQILTVTSRDGVQTRGEFHLHLGPTVWKPFFGNMI